MGARLRSDGPRENGVLVLGIDNELVTFSQRGLLISVDVARFQEILRHYAIPQG